MKIINRFSFRYSYFAKVGVWSFNKPFGAEPSEGARHLFCSEGAPHRCEPFKKGPVPRRIGRTKGGLNSKLHAVCDGRGRPIIMLLSEGQMSDYKGAALMLDDCRRRSSCSATRDTTPTGSATRSPRVASRHAFRRNQTARRRSSMIVCSTASGTRSKTCSAESRTGGASIPATIDALIPSCPQSASLPLSSSGSNQ